MTHYSEKTGSVRADLFNPDGKWSTTIALDMTPFWESTSNHALPYGAVELAWRERLRGERYPEQYKGWFLFVQNPYHQYATPVMLKL